MNLVRKGLTPAGHVSFSDLIGKVGIDGDGLQLSGCTKTLLDSSRELQLLGFSCELGWLS